MPKNPENETIEAITTEIVAFFAESSRLIADKFDFPLHEQINNDPKYSLLQLSIDYKGRIAFKYCDGRSNIGHAAETHTGIENIHRSDAKDEDDDKAAWRSSFYPFSKMLWTDQRIAQLLARNNITAKMLKDSLVQTSE